MRVLLVSDSHGRNQNMEKVIRKVSPVDLLIHLGDLEGSEGYLEAIAPCPVEILFKASEGEGHYDWQASDLYDAWP